MSATQRCPRCGSYNTSTSIDYKIKKGLGYVAEFGIGFLAGRYLGDAGVAAVEDVTIADGVEKEWQCDACGHKWRASEQKHESTFSNNPSSPNNTKLVHAKPKPALKSPSHSSSPSISQQKQYNKHDRAKLLEIIYISDGRHNNWKDEHAPIQNNTRLFEELQKHSINVSKSVISSVNTYKRLADKILDRGWTFAAYKALVEPTISSEQKSQNVSEMNSSRQIQFENKLNNIKIITGIGEEITITVTNDPNGLRDQPFSMQVVDTFDIEGRGQVITGKIKSGYITLGDVLYFNENQQNTAIVVGIECFNKLLNYAEFGDNVGLLIREATQPIQKGDVVSKTIPTQVIENNSYSNDASNVTNEQEYIAELKECLADGDIGSGERRLLDKLRSKLGISEERAAELEASLRKPQLTAEEQEYLEAYKEVVEDGAISEKERRLLNKLIKMYNISETRAKEIEEMAHK